MGRLAVIPIRSGSKGLKNKNILPLNGKPLVSYTITEALKSRQFDRVIVSTDSNEYAVIARQFGAEVPFLRSAKNSSDSAGSWDTVQEVIGQLEEMGEFYDEVMLLQATSPLRTAEDITGSIKLMQQKGAYAVQSVTEMDHSPLWAGTLPESGCMDGFGDSVSLKLPRQQLPKFYRINGAVYLVKKERIGLENMLQERCYAYLMPRERSIDIDTAFDFKLAEFYMKEMDAK